MNYDTDLKHAIELADAADIITKRYFRSADMHVKTKPDNTPVTQGDLEVEHKLSSIVSEKFHESYIGEEGTSSTSGKRTWVVDPIDGTKNFVRGMPVWATLIGLVEDGVTVAAVVSAPALGRRWWAAKGLGAWTKDTDGTERSIAVSGIQKLEDAFILTGSIKEWEKPDGFDDLLKLIKSAYRHRAVGDFFNYMLVAEGAADASTEAKPKYWDIAAPELIITEAGGSLWTDANKDTTPGSPRIVVASNGLIEEEVRTALKL